MAVVILIVNYWGRPLMPLIPIVINIIPQWYFPHSCQDRHFTQWGRVNPNNKIEILSLWFQKRTNVNYWSNSLSSDWDSKILNQNLTKTQYTGRLKVISGIFCPISWLYLGHQCRLDNYEILFSKPLRETLFRNWNVWKWSWTRKVEWMCWKFNLTEAAGFVQF